MGSFIAKNPGPGNTQGLVPAHRDVEGSQDPTVLIIGLHGHAFCSVAVIVNPYIGCEPGPVFGDVGKPAFRAGSRFAGQRLVLIEESVVLGIARKHRRHELCRCHLDESIGHIGEEFVEVAELCGARWKAFSQDCLGQCLAVVIDHQSRDFCRFIALIDQCCAIKHLIPITGIERELLLESRRLVDLGG